VRDLVSGPSMHRDVSIHVHEIGSVTSSPVYSIELQDYP
jgi:hypothetical protein